MSQPEDIQGPYIVWTNYGYEGWSPSSYPDLKSALLSSKYYDFVITKKVQFEVSDVTNDAQS